MNNNKSQRFNSQGGKRPKEMFVSPSQPTAALTADEVHTVGSNNNSANVFPNVDA
jgi:hypothetical protein